MGVNGFTTTVTVFDIGQAEVAKAEEETVYVVVTEGLAITVVPDVLLKPIPKCLYLLNLNYLR